MKLYNNEFKISSVLDKKFILFQILKRISNYFLFLISSY
ncbi:hypothetical protein SMGD1_2512 [Sulfurimonas gotlandica GD1]|uniref:Uncharacterized protein n=1 Tax=Sulfurimonas gotlandica (strain DSM 19862 / JCM 16533 / GD1) TaxID=929558 RepID=B6BNG4_SULGG|nr:hypothetical protein CBGD1_2409 [Sulfurimonas gotlandica GD1]EHP31034.1 hypothetical protein SMGD1_2512 [Sulfurimonas gotlandica GD1]